MKRLLISLCATTLVVAPFVVMNQPVQQVVPQARCVEPKGGIAPVAFSTPLPGARVTDASISILAGCGGGGGGTTTCFPVMRPAGPCR